MYNQYKSLKKTLYIEINDNTKYEFQIHMNDIKKISCTMSVYPLPQSLPSPGSLYLYDSYTPSLSAGTNYNINASYTVYDTATNVTKATNTISQQFQVSAPRWNITSEEIYSCSPAPNSNSVFATHLANIVFQNPQLPWERSILSNVSVGTPGPGPVPWFALLVFSNGDVNALNNPLELQQLPTGNTITQNSDFTYTVPIAKICSGSQALTGVTLPNFSDTTTPTSTEQTQNCKVICFNSSLFNKFFVQAPIPNSNTGSGQSTNLTTISPSLYTHVRQVNPQAQPDNGVDENGLYSVVFANRFPQTPTTSGADPIINQVHLVSLEGWYSYIMGLATLPTQQVCMVSLYSWSFGCLASINEEDFSTIMEAIIGNPWLYPTPKLSHVEFLAPVAISNSTNEGLYLSQRQQEGYYPVQYHLRTGEDTIAWYRGPLTPIQITAPTPGTSSKGLPFPSSVSGTDLMIWDPNYGMFDVTYTTAWQLGRSLAIASKTFPVSLMNFRRVINTNVNIIATNSQVSVPPTQEKTLFTNNISNMIAWVTSNTINKYINPQPGVNSHTLDANIDQGVVGLQTNTIVNLNSAQNPLNEGYPANIGSLITTNIQGYIHSSLAANTTFSTSSDLDQILNFLGDLRLFNNLPFHYMVPDPNSLPVESLRYFYVDTYWVSALIDGALSIGVHVEQDINFRSAIVSQLNIFQPTIQLPIYGFFLRSIALSSWPGLNIFSGDINNPPTFNPNPLTGPLLEIRRVPPDIIMGLFNAIVPAITISQPSEQLRFGLSGEDNLNTGDLILRSLQSTGSRNIGQIVGPIIEYEFLTNPNGESQPINLLQLAKPNNPRNIYKIKRDKLKQVSKFLSASGQPHSITVYNSPRETLYTANPCLDATTRILNTYYLQQLYLSLSSPQVYLSASQFAMQMTGAAEAFVLGLKLSPPTGVGCTSSPNSNNNVITVSWTNAADTRVSSYNIYHQVPDMGIWTQAYNTTNSNIVFNNLQLGTSYLFAVISSNNSSGRSDPVFCKYPA